MKTTLIIGASNNPERYSYKAAHKLLAHGHSIIPFGVKRGSVADLEILNEWDETWECDTVTMYVNPRIQKDYYDQIISLKPRRVIFNPGTENEYFSQLLSDNGIETENACTLVLLSINEY